MDLHPHSSQPSAVDFHPNAFFLLAKDRDLGDPVHLIKARAQVIGSVIHFGIRKPIARHRDGGDGDIAVVGVHKRAFGSAGQIVGGILHLISNVLKYAIKRFFGHRIEHLQVQHHIARQDQRGNVFHLRNLAGSAFQRYGDQVFYSFR